MALVIGSTALLHHCPWAKSPNDLDIIGTLDEYNHFSEKWGAIESYPLNDNKAYMKLPTGRIVDFEIAWEGSSGEKLLQIEKNSEFTLEFAPLEVLYALKLSHRYLKNSPFFNKTMDTIKFLRKEIYPKISEDHWKSENSSRCFPPYLREWFEIREKETYNYKLPNLNQNKENFFTSNFQYIYDHDSIHKAVALYDKPAYKYYQEENSEVFCSKELFFQQSKEIRLAGVIEETYVLALERSQIPNNGNVDRKTSFKLALEKVCTSITSGWFRQFAWENYDDILKLYNDNYVDNFLKALNDGTVTPINSS